MEVNLLIEGDFAECSEADWLRSVAEKVLLAEKLSPYAELGLVITSQEKVQELNKSYRGEDKPTDVLAFSMTSQGESEAQASPFITPPDGVLHLGEVIISYPQAVIQAGQRQHSISKELAILIIHGVLHLLGYDHKKRSEARRMQAREEEILRRIEVD